MVDEDRVLRLLRSIADDTAVLRQEARAGQERRQDAIWLRPFYLVSTYVGSPLGGTTV